MVVENKLIGNAGTLLAVLLLLSLSAVIVNADLSLRNVNILKSYGPGQNLEGSFEMRLDEEPANSELQVVVSNSASEINKTWTLANILKGSDVNFTCSTSDCSPTYTKGGASKISLIGTGEDYVGLLVKNGNNTQITSLSFSIIGKGNADSCRVSPLLLDLLGDGSVDWQYSTPGGFCDQLSASSTYKSSSASDSYKIGDTPYCEKLNLPKAGRFKLGIDMVNATNVVPIIMSINDLENGEDVECNIVPGNGIRTCEVNFTIASARDFYVCVQSSDEGDYKIKAEIESPSCGKFGLEEFKCDDSLIDYAIYAQPAAFKIFNETAQFNADTFNEFNTQDLLTYLQDYINGRYNGNCDGAGCIIPLKITSAQNAELNGLSFRYTNNLGSIDSSDFYPLDKEEAIITTVNYTKIQLSRSPFQVPSIYGSYHLIIFAGSEKVIDTSIRIEKVPIIRAVTPLVIFAAVNSGFSAFVESPDNNSIVRYDWDFGDGSSSTTGIPYTNHTYPTGNFDMILTATDSKGLSSSKTFTIVTQQPREATNMTLAMKKANLAKIASLVNLLPQWYSDLAKNSLNLQKIGTNLESLQSDFSQPGADYASIKIALDNTPVYSGLNDDSMGTIQVLPIANVEYLGKIGESITPGKEAEIKSSVESWDAGNIEMIVKATKKVAIADTGKADDAVFATLFEVNLNSIDDVPKNNIYFIVKLPAGMAFEDIRVNTNSSVQNLDGAFGLVLERVDSNKIEFALPGSVDPSELEIFVSPTISIVSNPEVRCGNLTCESSFGENNRICPEDCKKPISSAIWLSIVIVLVSLTGIFLIWKYYAAYYARKMRQSLFPKDSDFYSISFFVANEINKGTEEGKIRTLLSKAEWGSQQVDYALKSVKDQTKKIQKQSILNFVTGEMKSGKKEAEIRVRLALAGWNIKLIDWAVNEARKNSIKNQQ